MECKEQQPMMTPDNVEPQPVTGNDERRCLIMAQLYANRYVLRATACGER